MWSLAMLIYQAPDGTQSVNTTVFVRRDLRDYAKANRISLSGILNRELSAMREQKEVSA